MSEYYDFNFLSNVYSEETSPVTESEYDDVMRLMAEEDGGWRAYCEWACRLESTEARAALEQRAFERDQERLGSVVVDDAQLLIKLCECCNSSSCKREVRVGGIVV
jgi:hypothetical protein